MKSQVNFRRINYAPLPGEARALAGLGLRSR